MKWSIGSKIGSGFGLALAVLMVVGAVSYNSTAKLIDSAEWVRHTHEVLNGADNTLSSLKDAETGQRGYLITGEESYLEPYQGSRELVDQELKRLRELTSDNPVQQTRLNALEPLVRARFATLQQVIELRKARGSAAAAQEVLKGKGNRCGEPMLVCTPNRGGHLPHQKYRWPAPRSLRSGTEDRIRGFVGWGDFQRQAR